MVSGRQIRFERLEQQAISAMTPVEGSMGNGGHCARCCGDFYGMTVFTQRPCIVWLNAVARCSGKQFCFAKYNKEGLTMMITLKTTG